MINISINKRALDNIIFGKKTIEGRLVKGIFDNIKIGDECTFYNRNISCNVKITKINYYNSFYELLEGEKLDKILPYCDTIFDGIELYNKIYKQQINKYPAMAIYINLI
jgi:ASC-1-like (ASCH) protein